MEIKEIRLSNVGRFVDLQVVLAPTSRHPSRVTVLVGNNGAGKTTLLRSVATSLSWLVARIRSEKGSGVRIDMDSVHKGSNSAAISISVRDWIQQITAPDDGGQLLEWTLSGTRQGRKANTPSSLEDVSRLADSYRELLTSNENASLPLVAYYPVERSVLKIPLRIRTRHTFDQLHGYDSSLSQGVDFRRFFEWFREREDGENESGVSSVALAEVQQKFGEDSDIWKTLSQLNASSRDRQLTAVRSAIAAFMPGFSNLRIRRKPLLEMVVNKEGMELNVSQLSQGEKSMMALVGDIACRLAMMNPSMENPLQGEGFVLIDEVDLHLHPKWQRSLIQQLTTTFPQCQFLLTTHSPLVISDSKDVLCYVMDDGELQEQSSLYGQDANQVLLSVMDTDVRNSDVQHRLDELQASLQDGRLEEAKSLYESLSKELPPGHIELAKAALLIRKLEIRRA